MQILTQSHKPHNLTPRPPKEGQLLTYTFGGYFAGMDNVVRNTSNIIVEHAAHTDVCGNRYGVRSGVFLEPSSC